MSALLKDDALQNKQQHRPFGSVESLTITTPTYMMFTRAWVARRDDVPTHACLALQLQNCAAKHLFLCTLWLTK
jgi:hypothetical protein